MEERVKIQNVKSPKYLKCQKIIKNLCVLSAKGGSASGMMCSLWQNTKKRMKNKIKKQIIFSLKIIITILILFFISKKIDFYQLQKSFFQITFSTILIIFFTTFIKLFIQYNNWGKYLHLNSDYVPKKYEILKSYFVGMALHFLLPAGLGLFGKMYFVNNKKRATAISVGVERIFVTWKNLFFASFAAIFFFQSINLFLKIIIFVFVTLLPFLFYLFGFLTKNQKIKLYFDNYLKIVPRIITMQIIFVFISLYQYFLILKTFVDIKFFDVIISVPIVHFSHIIPISFSGFGLREIFAMNVFSKFGISIEAAITTTLTIFFVNSVLPALVGLYLLLKAKR